jgi:hypothetical protein
MLALYNVILSLTMTKSKDPKPLLTMPSVMVQENNSRFVGHSEVIQKRGSGRSAIMSTNRTSGPEYCRGRDDHR